MFFYWQLGALDELARRYDLSGAHFHGASAGALSGTLAACRVDGREAAEAAFKISLDCKLWDNPTGLAGVWGPLVRQWLELLLPEDAGERCSSRLHLQLLELPSISHREAWFQHRVVSRFKDKAEVLECCMASVHIPFFMDTRPWTRFQGRRCIDGSILAPRHTPGSAEIQGQVIVLDHSLDEVVQRQKWDFLSLGEGGHEATWNWIQTMMCRGSAFVQDLAAVEQLAKLRQHPHNLVH